MDTMFMNSKYIKICDKHGLLPNLTDKINLKTAMVSGSRFFWITNSSDHRRVSTGNLLHTKWLPNPPGHNAQ